MMELRLVSRDPKNLNDTPDSEPRHLSNDECLFFIRAFRFDFAASAGKAKVAVVLNRFLTTSR